MTDREKDHHYLFKDIKIEEKKTVKLTEGK